MDIPQIGVGVILLKDDKILLGKRLYDKSGPNWGFPGGHLDKFEAVEDCAIRETKEETNLNVKKLQFLTYTEDFFKDINEHFITLIFISKEFSGELSNKEEKSFEDWKWFDMNKLPENLSTPMKGFLKQNINLK